MFGLVWMSSNTHKRGRPKGSKNKTVAYPTTKEVPEGRSQKLVGRGGMYQLDTSIIITSCGPLQVISKLIQIAPDLTMFVD